MAFSHNSCTFIGYLGADPEVKKLDRSDVANFSVAVTERWGDGRDQEHTEWVRCVTYQENLVSLADRFMRKGEPVLVRGSIRSREFRDRDGNDRQITELRVFEIQLLGQAPEGGGRGGGRDDRGGGRDDRGGGRDTRSDDRGRDRGRDDRGGSRDTRSDDRGRGRDDRSDRGRDDRGGDRRDDRGGDRRDDRSSARGAAQGSRIEDDNIPF